MSSYSNTRWWSHWEVQHQVLQQFGDVEPFLQQHEDISPATRTKILTLLHNPQELLVLKLELAAVVDIGSYLVKATYNLESDGALSIKCYEEILKIRCTINAKYYPNLQAVTREDVLVIQHCNSNLWIMVLNACNLGWTIFTTSLEMILNTLCLLSRQPGYLVQL